MDNNSNFTNNRYTNNDLQLPTTNSQAENSNNNYNDANTPNDYNNRYPMMNGDDSSASYTNIPGNVPMSSQSYLTTSSVLPHPLPQYNTQNAPQFNQNNSSSFNTINFSQINHSEIFTFDVPGIKIIVISTFPPMINSSQTNHSEIFTIDIPGSKVIIITLSFQ
jgi:hypothetical protein